MQEDLSGMFSSEGLEEVQYSHFSWGGLVQRNNSTPLRAIWHFGLKL